MHEDVEWLFGIIIIFGLVWYVSFSLGHGGSGTASSTSTGGSSGESQYYGGSSYYGPGAYNGYSNSQSLSPEQQIQQGINEANQKASQVEQSISALEKARTTSPLSGKLRIGNVSAGAGTNGAYEYVVIQAASNNTSAVYISGLRLESIVTGRGANIPNGAYLPLQNSINNEEPVALLPGGVAYIMTGHSPLGMSFRTNECTGYFAQYQNFSPVGLSSRCPAPATEPLPPPANQYDDACLDYLNSLSGCRVVVNPPKNISPACQTFVATKLNYTECVNSHKGDPGFYDNQWFVYLGRDDGLWKSRRELIRLVDTDGKIVDQVTY